MFPGKLCRWRGNVDKIEEAVAFVPVNVGAAGVLSIVELVG